MRFTKLWIDGYGRFARKEIELASGLQVVAGPNEQGKSTLRHFVSDMLYGQKRSANQRVYDEANELRYPWSTEDGYGGRAQYLLDSGREIEVQRSFDRKNESIRIFDRTNAREITSEFSTLRNRESTFADKHLGMSKDVYLGMATISHVTLDELGDKQALAQIREKLLSLADSGTGESSAEAALRWLQDRITAIGQQTARTKPLPLARNRLLELQKEYEDALALRREVADIEQNRQNVLQEIASLEQRRQALQREFQLHEKRERAERYRKAAELQHQIDEMTKKLEAMADVEEFPTDRVAEVRRAATVAETARLQVERTEADLEREKARLESELEPLGADRELVIEELDTEYETKLAELDAQIRRLTDQLQEAEEARGHVESRLEQAQADLKDLPDFSRLAADPVEWLTQLASSFGIARRTRDDEAAKLTRLESAAASKREALAFPQALFAECTDFPESIRRYHEAVRSLQSHTAEGEREAAELEAQAHELMNRIPGSAIIAALGITGALVFTGTALYTGNSGIHIPAFFAGLMGAYFLGSVIVSRRKVHRAFERMEEIEREQGYFEETAKRDREEIEALMHEAECANVRELEAIYDKYREDSIQFQILEEQRVEQEQEAAEARERVDRLYERVCETIAKAGEEVANEDDVQAAAMRAISRYQEYRDAKRRTAESRDLLERRQKEVDRINGELDKLRQEELRAALEVRQVLRDHGYHDEQKSDTALKALRGYRIRSAQVRQKRGEADAAEAAVHRLEQQLAGEREEADTQQHRLTELLEDTGADSYEAFEERAARADEYRQLLKERTALEDQRDAYLQGQTWDALKAAVEADGPLPKYTARTKDELQRDLERLDQDLDAARKQDHMLHLTITERSAGSRSLNEVDEERASVGQQVRDLELELQAASYAMAVLEEVTRERHSKIAPQLAALASTYLDEITDGVYNELLLNRDMQISVRIPQTKALNTEPEAHLSKGTVDQIYLALRLAMVQTMSDNTERIPMLLDDPFANYDDERLARAMKLLARVGETNQILLFTCREDVIRAAQAVEAPVYYL